MRDRLTQPRPKAVLLGGAAILVSWVFFLIDIGAELIIPSETPVAEQPADLVHQAFEVVALIGLTFGLFFLYGYVRAWRSLSDQQAEQIRKYRPSFARMLDEDFDRWQLTPAERDVAVLVLRGLPNSAIAEARETSVSTVKGQLHSIFGKYGVETRNQFMNHFMELIFRGEPDADAESLSKREEAARSEG